MIVIIAITVENIFIVTMTKAMSRNVLALKKLSEGELNIQENSKDLNRKDEIGEIVQATQQLKKSLVRIIEGVNEAASSMLSACEELEQVSEETATTTEGIEKAVEDMATGAMSQA